MKVMDPPTLCLRLGDRGQCRHRLRPVTRGPGVCTGAGHRVRQQIALQVHHLNERECGATKPRGDGTLPRAYKKGGQRKSARVQGAAVGERRRSYQRAGPATTKSLSDCECARTIDNDEVGVGGGGGVAMPGTCATMPTGCPPGTTSAGAERPLPIT